MNINEVNDQIIEKQDQMIDMIKETNKLQTKMIELLNSMVDSRDAYIVALENQLVIQMHNNRVTTN